MAKKSTIKSAYSKPKLIPLGKINELTNGKSGTSTDGSSGRAGKANLVIPSPLDTLGDPGLHK